MFDYRQGDDASVGPMGISTDTIGRNGLGGTASGISGRLHETVSSHTCLSSSAEYELALILKEIRYITDQVIILQQFFQKLRILYKKKNSAALLEYI